MRLIDLTFDIEKGMPALKVDWHINVDIQQLGTIDKEGRNTHQILLGTHTGTHMDAPLHFIKKGISIDRISPEFFIQEALLLRVSDKTQHDVIDVEDIKSYDKFPANIEAAVIHTGWSKKWMSEDYYKAWPYLTKDAAAYLIKKGIKVLGMDMPSPDPYVMLNKGKDSPIHKMFLQKGVILIEYLTNLEFINKDRFKLYAFPLKFKGLDGSPARVIAEL